MMHTNQNDEKNYYDILEVTQTASADEIAAAKNRLAKKFHPDTNLQYGIDTTEQMQEILEAYRILSDPVSRADYDQSLQGHRSSMQKRGRHRIRRRFFCHLLESFRASL